MRNRRSVAAAMWVMVAAAACAREPGAVTEPAAVTAPAAEAQPARETFAVEPELAEAAIGAIDLWTEATGGEYAPELIIGDAPGGAILVGLVAAIDDCGHDAASGCMRHRERRIDVSRVVPEDMRISTIAHEIGHLLGVEHTNEGLMDPDRSKFRRRAPCVLAEDVAAAGLAGPGACLF